MVQLSLLLNALTAIASLNAVVSAHPGEVHNAEEEAAAVVKRNEFAAYGKRSLANCQNSIKARSLAQRAVARRHAKAESLRKKRSLDVSSKFH